MSTRAHGPMAGFHWLRRAINVGRHNPRALFGAASMLMAVWIMPTVLQIGLHAFFDPGEGAEIVIAALLTLLSAATLVPLMGGYLRLLDASERGRPAHANEIFEIFRAGHAWRTCMVFALLMLLVHLAVTSALVSQLGTGLMDWAENVMKVSQQAKEAGPGAKPPAVPALPPGAIPFAGLSSVWLVVIGCAFAVGLGQIALTGRNVRTALVDGFAGTAKNLLPLALMAVCGFGAMVVASVALAMVILVLGTVANLVHPVLAMAVVVPLYVAFLTVVYAVLLSLMYQMWRDIAGEDAPVDGHPDSTRPDQLAA